MALYNYIVLNPKKIFFLKYLKNIYFKLTLHLFQYIKLKRNLFDSIQIYCYTDFHNKYRENCLTTPNEQDKGEKGKKKLCKKITL